MNQHHFQEYMQDYAAHFDLHKDINFDTSVKRVTRNEADTKWLIEAQNNGATKTVEFDRVVFCHGYQTRAKVPTFKGQEQFEGVILHSQQYRRYINSQDTRKQNFHFLTGDTDPRTLRAKRLSLSVLEARPVISFQIW